MEKYRIIETIGDGTYGTVYKGIKNDTNEYVAIKKMKKQYTDWEECKSLKEVVALRTLKHSNIVTLNELILEKNELIMVFEFIGVNLFEYLKNLEEIPEYKIRNIAFQALQGLAYMHKNNFFHRDIKPENILISGDQVKLADFGLAKEIKSEPPFTDYVATRWYRAPEVILNSKTYSSPIDIFALGAIIAELYLNAPLFPGKNAQVQMNKICEILGTPNQNDWPEGYELAKEINYKFPQFRGKKLKNVIKNASESAINLLELMLNFNPAKRPSAVKCLQHPFFQCYEVLKFYGIKFNNREEQENNNEDKNENYNNNFSLSMNNIEQFRGDLNDSFGNSTEVNKNQTFKNGSKFEEFLTNN